MAREIEIKLRLSDPGHLRIRLRVLHAVRVDHVAEVNHIFDAPDRRLLKLDQGLRVREWRSLVLGGESGVTLTFKGARDAGALKSREESETTVADANAVIAILQYIGFNEVITYEKRRETWRLEQCEVTVDELPHLGFYTEIEGPTAEAIDSVRSRLGLAEAEPINATYAHMTFLHGELSPSGVCVLLFGA